MRGGANVLDGDEIRLADQRRVHRLAGDDPPVGQVPPLHRLMSQGDITRVGQVPVGPLPVPHLTARIPRVPHDRGDRAQRPARARAVRVPAWVGPRRAGHARVIQRPRDPRHRMTRQPPGENPPDDTRGLRIGLEAVSTAAPSGVCLIRVRPRITQPVPVRRAAAEVPALLPGLDRHRGPDPDAGPGHLPLGRQPEVGHRLLIMLGGVVDRAARLRHPQLDAVVPEQRRHGRVLAAVERPLILPHHNRVPAPTGIRQEGDQRGGFRAPAPRHRAALPGVEELRHDHPVTPDQRLRLLPLSRPRGRRILPVLRRHPPVEHEPQTARACGPSTRRRPDSSAHATRPSAPAAGAVPRVPSRTVVMVATSPGKPHSRHRK